MRREARARHQSVLADGLSARLDAEARRYETRPTICDKCGASAEVSRSGGVDGHTMLCRECRNGGTTDHEFEGLNVTAAEDYMGGHQPLRSDPGIWELDKIFPDDVYTHPHYYGHGGNPVIERESAAVIRRVRGNPSERVTIYRSVPPNVDDLMFHTGNWVAVSRSYADLHGEGRGYEWYDPDSEWTSEYMDGVQKGEWKRVETDWVTIAAETTAEHIRSGGNDIIEYGYWGPPIQGRVVTGQHRPEHRDRRRELGLISSRTAGRKRKSKGDTMWLVPGKKRPIAYSTNATSYLIEILADEGLTFSEAKEHLIFDPEGRDVMQAYIDRGFGDTRMSDLGVRTSSRRTAARATELPLAEVGTVVTAADDYPELTETLWEHPDHVQAVPVEINQVRFSKKAGLRKVASVVDFAHMGGTHRKSPEKDAAIDLVNALGDGDLIAVYHASTESNIASIMEAGGYEAGNLGIGSGEASFTAGIYVSATPDNARLYGPSVVRMVVRKGDLVPSQEAIMMRADSVGAALFRQDSGAVLQPGRTASEMSRVAVTLEHEVHDNPNQPAWFRNVVGPALEKANEELPRSYQVDDLTRLPSSDWCRFRRDNHCFFPNKKDEPATQAAGYDVWVPVDRGPCPRATHKDQRSCPVAEPGPNSHERSYLPDATVPWESGGQRMGSKRTAGLTGYPEMDAAINDFLDTPLAELSGDTPRQVNDSGSHGLCQAISEEFVEFCKARGIDKVYATHTDLDEMGYTIQPGSQGGEIGFNENDEMEYGHYQEHTVNSYYPPGAPPWGIVIDFTATQYGYSEFPKISSTSSKTASPRPGNSFEQSIGTGAWYRQDSQAVGRVLVTEDGDRSPLFQHWGPQGDPAHCGACESDQKHSEAYHKWFVETDPYGWGDTFVEGSKTAAWKDVNEKAVRIRRDGGVRIISDAGGKVTAEVRGDNGLYTTAIQRAGKGVAVWECSCPWSKYAWDRSQKWKRLEGRKCAHATALLYEMQSNEMFGGEIEEIAEAPDWRTEEPTLDRRDGEVPIDYGVQTYDVVASKSARSDLSEYERGYQSGESQRGKNPGEINAPRSTKWGDRERGFFDGINGLPKSGSLDEGLDDLLETIASNEITHAGLIVKAASSGRVLMTQRTPYHGDDENTYGKWEFPGGGLDDGEDPIEGAMREFFEETGLELPDSYSIDEHFLDGKYLGIIITVPDESWTTDAELLDLETMGIGWFELDMVADDGFSRPEVADVDTELVSEAILEDEPEPVLEGDGNAYGADDPEDDDRPFVPGDDRLAHLSGSGDDGDNEDIALAAQAFLAKSALKVFSPAEQQALIDEGLGGLAARNDDVLNIEGTFYESQMDDWMI